VYVRVRSWGCGSLTHLLTEAENPTIAWNQHITHFQPDEEEEPLNFLERYFDLPEDISQKLQLDLANDKMADIMQLHSKLYKLHCLKTKLKNCLTHDLALDIDTSMHPGLPNKDGRLFFIKLVLHTFLDKEAHKRIIYEYILKLKITESNNMEIFQRELRRHTIQYEAIQGMEWKKITNHIIKQYQKIDSPPFYTGFNMIAVDGPSANQTKYEWIIKLLTWTTASRHDLLSRDLWPKPEIKTGQELNTMPIHDNQWGTATNTWRSHGPSDKTKSWTGSSPRLTTPRLISTAATAERPTISYDPRQSKHIFTKININEPKPTDNIWIGTSHVFLPTFWCQKCNNWSSHHDQLHDERICWQNNKNAQMAKMDEHHKQTEQNHYGPPQQSSYNRNDSNKRPNSNYNRDNYQDKRARNDHCRSNSRDRSNSQTRSPRSPGGDNHRNGPYFYDEKKKY
jgi:hypothetical protein